MTTSSVSQSGCILIRKAGTFPPTELLEKILAANPHGWGAATVSEVDGTKFLELNGAAEEMTLEDLQDTLKSFPKQDIHFYFCNSPTALDAADMSPYVLVCTPAEEDEEQEDVKLVAFVHGNFPANAQAGSSHPPEYHLVKDVLTPKFEGLFEMVDGDLDKLMLSLMKPHFKKEMLLNAVSEGTIALVAANGVSITFHQGETAIEGPWGWCSNSYGYGAKAIEPPKPEKKPSMFSGKSTVREKAPSAAPKEEIKEVVKPTVTGAAAITNYTVKKWKPQESYSRKETRNAYKMRIGYCPVGWQDKIEVDVVADSTGKLMTMAQIRALGPTSIGVQQLMKNPPKEKDIEPDAVETKETLAATTQRTGVSEDILPLMSPKTREAVNDVRNKDGYKKIIEENAKVINDPKQAEGYETRFADFNKQLGIKTMQEFAHWDFKMIHDLNKSNPSAIEVMLWTFKNICLKNNLFKEEVETKVDATPTPAKKPSMFKRAG